MVKKFGAKEGVFKKLRSEHIESYKQKKLNFSQLVIGISNENLFDTYYQLREYEKFVVVPPLNFFDRISISASTHFVLDVPTVLLFTDLEDELGIKFNQKFTISFYVKEYFKLLLKDEQNEMKSNISLNINETGVQPIFYPVNFQNSRINKLEKIIKWIDINCVVGIPKGKLELLNQLKNKDGQFNGFFRGYTIDTFCLANQDDGCLITNDTFYFNLLNNNSKVISTENFLKIRFKNIQYIISKLIEYNYVGLNVPSAQLLFEFEKSPVLESANNRFIKSLRSLDYFYSQSKENLDQALEFLKYLYSLSINKTIKKRISQAVLHSVLKNYPFDKSELASLKKKFTIIFSF